MSVSTDRPWFSATPMRCRSCANGYYTGWMINGCTLEMAAAYMRAMTCPRCGADASCQVIVTPDTRS